MTSITIRNLKKEFGNVVAVKNIDLEIKDGEFVTFVGPSGCGKTTSLRLVSGLEQADGGTIHFGDRDVTNELASKRNIGMVFQNLALYPHMTVRENMAFGLEVANVDPGIQTERIETTAEMLDITELLDRKPSQLSGGQQQRVAIGRTLVLDPDVFLLDEPLASLDAKLRVEIREELQQLHEKVGVTTIYVTHDQHQAMTMSDRIVVMNDGEVQQFATPEEVYRQPANEFVANFIGTPSMNIFDCTIKSDGTQPVADLQFTQLPLTGTSTVMSAPTASGTVRFGIRPEHVELASTNSGTEDHENTFSATARLIEPTGAEKIVHFDANGTEITTVFSEEVDIQKGSEYPIQFNADRIQIFNGEIQTAVAPEQ